YLANSAAPAENGSMYLAGSYGGQYAKDSVLIDSVWVRTKGKHGDVIIAKINSNGELFWFLTAGGNGAEMAQAIVSDRNKNCYVFGFFYRTSAVTETLIFNKDTLITSTNATKYFLSKISQTPVGLTEIQAPHQFIIIFPNPTSGMFTIKSMNSNNSSICIYDVLGNCILNKTPLQNNSHTIDLSTQAKGIYFVEISSGGEKVVKKISLQ
ncbi:MAG: T9SS type A sorting domain-containing protein, partial [Saprospiraceae bacterium]|nr:T9SS type A sorting domain-containing protein [Saprospiraceae bacterium]